MDFLSPSAYGSSGPWPSSSLSSSSIRALRFRRASAWPAPRREPSASALCVLFCQRRAWYSFGNFQSCVFGDELLQAVTGKTYCQFSIISVPFLTQYVPAAIFRMIDHRANVVSRLPRRLPGRGRVLPSLPGVLMRTQNFWGVPHSSTPLRTRPAQLPQSPATMSRRSRRMQPLPVSPSRCKFGALVRDPCADILAIFQHQMARAWKPRRVSGDIR